MRLQAHDQGYVAAAPEAVYATVADPSTYPRWWPGASTTGTDGGVRIPLGSSTVDARPEGHREGLGLYLAVPHGSIEWYLEPFEDGSIVNVFSDLDLPGGARAAARRLHGARSSVHTALVHLKRLVEGS